MKTIKANFLDIHKRQIYVANVEYSDIIHSITQIADEPDKNLPFIVPGFIDSHVHIESSMLTPARFAEMVCRFGTIGVVCDPHEIANVCGEHGVRFMMEDAARSGFKFFFALPSCVPATPFETNGANFGLDQMKSFSDKVVALAEMMNFPGIIHDDQEVLAKLDFAKSHNLPIDGHCPGLAGHDLKKYASAGISTDHECFSIEEAKEKTSLGTKIQVREGSAAKNFAALSNLFLTDLDNLMVCTDDAHPDDILKNGHINRFIPRLKSLGLNIFDIYKPLLVNTVNHYRLPVGLLRQNDPADFLIVDNLDSFNVRQSIINGKVIYDSSITTEFADYSATHINNFASRSFSPQSFKIISKKALANVIEVIDGELITKKHLWQHNFPIGSEINLNYDDDIAKIAVINRYSADAPISLGFIRGTGLRSGAIASSIAHDSHNVVVIGFDDESICKAAQQIFDMKGGLVVVNGDESDYLSLPIAGLMTDEPCEEVADKYLRLIDFARRACGVTLKSPFMTMAFMSLLVIPSLKIGDRGLFDVDKFSFIDLFADEAQQ